MALGLGGQDWYRTRRAMEGTLSIGGGQRRRAGSRRDCGAEEEDWGTQWCQQGQHPTGAYLCPALSWYRDIMVNPHRQGTCPHINDSPGKQAIKEIHNKYIIIDCDERFGL